LTTRPPFLLELQGRNPIHHDEPFAQGAGEAGVFGMGMLHVGILGTRLARWVGPDSIRSFRVRFKGKVWPGDVLTFSGQVVALDRRDGEILASIELAVRSEREEVGIATRWQSPALERKSISCTKIVGT
jgi:acyl dehydratase